VLKTKYLALEDKALDVYRLTIEDDAI